MSNRDLIICSACHKKVATQFIGATMEFLHQEKEPNYRMRKMWLCDDCAQRVSQSTGTNQRMAEALAGGSHE
jgi:uncharacterized protein YlaI